MKFINQTIISIALSLFLVTGLSQNSTAQDATFGPKGGMGLHTLYGSDLDFGMRFGFQLGGFGQFHLSDMVALKPEFIYSLEGGQATQSTAIGDFKFRLNLHYLNIPVLVRAQPGNFYFEGGPSLNFLVGGSSVQISNNDKRKSSLDSEDVNNIELALKAGGGYLLENGVELGLRFDLGLTAVNDDTRGGDIKNFGIQAQAAYHISQ